MKNKTEPGFSVGLSAEFDSVWFTEKELIEYIKDNKQDLEEHYNIEIEDCPACVGRGFFGDDDGVYDGDLCETCDGTGMVGEYYEEAMQMKFLHMNKYDCAEVFIINPPEKIIIETDEFGISRRK